jgi:dGTPase
MNIDLNTLYSEKRVDGNLSGTNSDQRTEYQKDFDRIIFSSSFRRLQNKTQVFPLPGSVFVHNRLTHSLEVSSVGRSLGSKVGEYIVEDNLNKLTKESKAFYTYGLSNVIASACLCHDIGNPAFGHSGEDAISTFFTKNVDTLKSKFSESEWYDFINFEGNANAIRVLTNTQKGKSEGGLRLTSSTLCAIAKYPCESRGKNKGYIYRKKFGFFQSEIETFKKIAVNTGMNKVLSEPLIYSRHPFVWMVEAADDICYNIIDFEDAQRLGIIEFSECKNILMSLVKSLGNNDIDKINGKLDNIEDKNEQITYLRAISINSLIGAAAEKYRENFNDILTGELNITLFDMLVDECSALKEITEFSIENIYNHRSVLEIENAGYNVMYELLSHFILPLLKDKDNRDNSEKKALKLLPKNYNYDGESNYKKVLGVLDYVSGMTDNYATDLYRRIKGIDIGMRL